MTEKLVLRPGDIFLTQGSSFISKGIRFFSRSGGESRAEVNHVGIVVVEGLPHSAIIVEAASKVLRHSMEDYYNSKKNKVAVFRPKNIPEIEIARIVAKANSYTGMKYGYLKIVAHFFDWCIGGRYFFRRFAFMDKYPICSWVVAHAYADQGYAFGVDPGAATPDDIWKFVLTNADKYDMIHGLTFFKEK